MSSFAASLLLALAAVSTTSAHMQISKPYPFNSAFNPDTPEAKKDYSMTSPLVSDGPYPCKGFIGTADQGKRESWTAGETIGIQFAGSAVHGGGSCQFSLSYDNGNNFHVVQSYIGGCMTDTLNYDIAIPSSVPAGKDVIFSWTWFNKLGNREMYQNCFAVDIASQSTTPLTTPTIFVANAKVNTCSTVEGTPVVFPAPGDVVKYGGEYAGKSIGNGLTINAGVVGDSCFAPGSDGAGSGSSSGGAGSGSGAASSVAAVSSAVPSSTKAAATSTKLAASSSVAAAISPSSVAGIPKQSSSSAPVVAPVSSSKAYVAPSAASSLAIPSSVPVKPSASAKSSLPVVAAHVSVASSSAVASASASAIISSASVVPRPKSSSAAAPSVASSAAPSKASSVAPSKAVSVAVILPSSAKPTAVLITSTVPVKSPVSTQTAAPAASSAVVVNAKAAGKPCTGDSWTCDGQILNRCSYGSWVTIADCAAQSGVVCSSDTPIGCVWPWQASSAKKRDFSSSRHTARGHGSSHGKGPSRKRLVPNRPHSHQALPNAGVDHQQ